MEQNKILEKSFPFIKFRFHQWSHSSYDVYINNNIDRFLGSENSQWWIACYDHKWRTFTELLNNFIQVLLDKNFY